MSHLILPPGIRSVATRPAPMFRCELCGEEFLSGQQVLYSDHVARCVREHEAEIQQSRPSVLNRGGPFDPESWDQEEEAHMLDVGKRMLREKRLTIKPNERLS